MDVEGESKNRKKNILLSVPLDEPTYENSSISLVSVRYLIKPIINNIDRSSAIVRN